MNKIDIILKYGTSWLPDSTLGVHTGVNVLFSIYIYFIMWPSKNKYCNLMCFTNLISIYNNVVCGFVDNQLSLLTYTITWSQQGLCDTPILSLIHCHTALLPIVCLVVQRHQSTGQLISENYSTVNKLHLLFLYQWVAIVSHWAYSKKSMSTWTVMVGIWTIKIIVSPHNLDCHFCGFNLKDERLKCKSIIIILFLL